jgi:hypothetical protein
LLHTAQVADACAALVEEKVCAYVMRRDLHALTRDYD